MLGKKKQIKQEAEKQKLQNSEREQYNILKQKTIKELIAPSRNRCIKH